MVHLLNKNAFHNAEFGHKLCDNNSLWLMPVYPGFPWDGDTVSDNLSDVDCPRCLEEHKRLNP